MRLIYHHPNDFTIFYSNAAVFVVWWGNWWKTVIANLKIQEHHMYTCTHIHTDMHTNTHTHTKHTCIYACIYST